MKTRSVLICISHVVVLLVMAGCSSSSIVGDAEKTLRAAIESQSKGQIKLVKFTKKDGRKIEAMGSQAYELIYEAEIQFASDGMWVTGATMSSGIGFNFDVLTRARPKSVSADLMKFAVSGKDVNRGDRAKFSGTMVGQKYESGWKFTIGSAEISSEPTAKTSTENAADSGHANDSRKPDEKEGQASVKKRPGNRKLPPVPAPTENGFGFIDDSGSFVIPPSYGEADSFSEGLAKVELPPEDSALASDTPVFGFVDLKGKLQFKVASWAVGSFSEGLAWIIIGDKIGYINTTGKMVIPAQFDPIDKGGFPKKIEFGNGEFGTDFHEGFAFVSINSKRGYIDKKGKLLISLPTVTYNNHSYEQGWNNFSEGLAAFQIDQVEIKHGNDGQEYRFTNAFFGYIDRTGVTVIQPTLYRASPFADGLALVGTWERIGVPLFIDRTGKSPFSAVWVEAESFSEGLAAVRKQGERYCYIDKSGKVVLKTSAIFANQFSEGYARIRTEDGYGFIDKAGKLVMRPQLQRADPFRNGLARVTFDTHEGFVNADGDTVYSFRGRQRLGTDPPAPTCAQNLQAINESKATWQLGKHLGDEFVKTNGVPDLADLGLRFARRIPKCPNEGVYNCGDKDTPPRCSIHGNL